jgi:hypothetical protein
MKTEINDYLHRLQFGETQAYDHINIIPLHGLADGASPYIALADALAAGTLAVTEVTEGGSVPELLVVNDGTVPVFLIDGEELIGAKQNRVLNTSILLKEQSRTVVPVSCTERGRWAYSSAQFSSSDQLLAYKIRSHKSHSVSESLAQGHAAYSDQGTVWAGIAALHLKGNSSSPTSSMHDAYKVHAERLTECLKAFPSVEGQTGLMVIINGRVSGLDVVSRPEVYARVHQKLVRSYVLDALLGAPPVISRTDEPSTLAHTFIDSLRASREEVFPSVGYGQDHRYHLPGVTGNALVHEGRIVHTAFLSIG